MHEYRGSLQAPNWTADGKALIYAQEGRLYRFDLSSRSAEVINTGFATRNNNDHVLSFDGRMMGISHQVVEDSGASIIYTLPASGGTPRRVTAKGPSYLHGWSPDGRWLVYTGIRDDEADVYKLSVTGGDEIRLTSAAGLDAGTGYERRLEQLVPAPLAGREVDGIPLLSADRWRGRSSLLRACVASADAGRRRTCAFIAYVYGGQGTINVPSWSPDGTRIAFVTNSAMR